MGSTSPDTGAATSFGAVAFSEPRTAGHTALGDGLGSRGCIRVGAVCNPWIGGCIRVGAVCTPWIGGCIRVGVVCTPWFTDVAGSTPVLGAWFTDVTRPGSVLGPRVMDFGVI